MAPGAGKGGFKAAFIGAVSNASVQYNMQALSIALAFMKSQYPQPGWVKNTVLGAVFAGALVGMMCMGYLGDVIGRRRAMLLTLSLVVVGALFSALGSWDEAVYPIIAIARFAIGVGVGGVYPLAAATAAENEGSAAQSSDPSPEEAAAEDAALVKRVGWAFFWQTPGAMLPYLAAFALLALPSSTPALTSAQFRTILALGALPAAIVWVATFSSSDSDAFKKAAADRTAQQEGRAGSSSDEEAPARLNGEGSNLVSSAGGAFSWADAYERHRPYLATLVGTGGSWLLFDVAFYGTNIFTPQILGAIFGANESLFDTCWQSLVVQTMGLPATIATIMLMPKLGGRTLNIAGFTLMALSFGAMALLFGAYPASGQASNAKFALFAGITFAINFGPNVVTYVLPAQLFPTAVRSRYHGASAASGKVGAVIGSFMYTPIASGPGGLATVMWVQVALCLVGVLVSFALLPRTVVKGSHKLGSRGDDEDSVGVGETGAQPLLKG